MKNPLKWLRERNSAADQRRREWQEEMDALDRQMEAQYALLATGDEIRPPWAVFPDSTWYDFKDGGYAEFDIRIWSPYMDGLDSSQRREYFERWPPPPDWDWRIANYLR